MKRVSKTDEASTSKKLKTESSASEFLTSLQKHRSKVGESISDFKFNKKRVKILTKVRKLKKFKFFNSSERFQVEEVDEKSNGIAYWMARDQRVEDNWALLFSQKLAIKNKIPLHIVFLSH